MTPITNNFMVDTISEHPILEPGKNERSLLLIEKAYKLMENAQKTLEEIREIPIDLKGLRAEIKELRKELFNGSTHFLPPPPPPPPPPSPALSLFKNTLKKTTSAPEKENRSEDISKENSYTQPTIDQKELSTALEAMKNKRSNRERDFSSQVPASEENDLKDTNTQLTTNLKKISTVSEAMSSDHARTLPKTHGHINKEGKDLPFNSSNLRRTQSCCIQTIDTKQEAALENYTAGKKSIADIKKLFEREHLK